MTTAVLARATGPCNRMLHRNRTDLVDEVRAATPATWLALL